MHDDDEDGLEEWLALSDEQQDAELRKEIDLYNAWFDKLSPRQRYRYLVRKNLELIVKFKRNYGEFKIDFFKGIVLDQQKRLADLRRWKHSGYPQDYKFHVSTPYFDES